MSKLKSRFISLKVGAFIAFVLLGATLYLYVHEIKGIMGTPREAWEEDLTADCAIVLTGGPGRVKEGLDMLVRKQVQRLIVSGVNPSVGLRDLYPQLAMYPDINDEQIVLERHSATTFGNAQQSLPIVEALQCRDVLLVTSYLHMRRSYRTFLATFPEDVRIVPYAVSGNDFPPHVSDLIVEATKGAFYSLWAY
ncbi:MAG: hypothetical protein RJB66_1313 [Pseudomonadota bacterium]|jgi:uncharacterized SAM-binding protein YcdF (DUF218 family)